MPEGVQLVWSSVREVVPFEESACPHPWRVPGTLLPYPLGLYLMGKEPDLLNMFNSIMLRYIRINYCKHTNLWQIIYCTFYLSIEFNLNLSSLHIEYKYLPAFSQGPNHGQTSTLYKQEGFFLLFHLYMVVGPSSFWMTFHEGDHSVLILVHWRCEQQGWHFRLFLSPIV